MVAAAADVDVRLPVLGRRRGRTTSKRWFWCGLLTVFVCSFCTVVGAAAEPENDFDFVDRPPIAASSSSAAAAAPASNDTVKQRRQQQQQQQRLSAAKYIDELGLLQDEPGSGVEGDETEGSGMEEGFTAVTQGITKPGPPIPVQRTTTVRPRPGLTTSTRKPAFTIPPTRQVPVFTTPRPEVGEPEYFRSTINITSVSYNAALGDRQTTQFHELAELVRTEVEYIFQDVSGQQTVNVLQFRPGSLDPGVQPSVIATLDITTVGFYNRLLLFNVLNNALNRGYLSRMSVSPRGFSFRPITGTGAFCPTSLGRDPTSLPRLSDDSRASLMLNNQVTCDSLLRQIVYFRGTPDGEAFVGIWRQVADDEFILKHRVSLRPDVIGIHTISLPEPLPLERGDFLGIHYPRDAPSGIIAHSVPADGVVSANEMFQTMVVDASDEDLPQDRTISLAHFQRRLESRTFALQGILVADLGIPEIPTPPTCADHELPCASGQCYDERLHCDGHFDCPDRSDEINCPESTEAPLECTEYEFKCLDSSTCIDIRYRCDKRPDCDDSSDEADCVMSCSPSEFACSDGTCIDSRLRCDRLSYDCPDASDERDCGCSSRDFTCDDGTCIDQTQHCDGLAHCPDRSDEIYCPVTPAPPEGCSDHEFMCDDGQCVDLRLRCDRKYDCRDGSDELNCGPPAPRPCDESEFACHDGSCIDSRYICDRRNDCPDGSDEQNCAEVCNEQQFMCMDGKCVNKELVCDHKYDCLDGSDEFSCVTSPPIAEHLCGPNEFACEDGRSCIPSRLVCDGVRDCADGTDEFHCGTLPPGGCTSAQFMCDDGACIDAAFQCDHKYDCRDGSDEFDCPAGESAGCSVTEFACIDGTCIEQSLVCNGVFDCRDQSDEQHCPVHPEPPARSCSDREFQCADGTCIDARLRCDRNYDCPDGTDEFDCPADAGCSSSQFRCNVGSCIDLHYVCDGYAHCVDGSDEFQDACDKIRPPTQPPVVEGCSANEWKCGDGACIKLSQRCDRREYNCADGTDEFDCPAPTEAPPLPSGCSTGEFTCGDGTCIQESLLCDRHYDCPDASDEFDCPEPTIPVPTIPVPTGCRDSEFRCQDGTCIDAHYRCDFRYQCPDGTDESECPAPTEPSRGCSSSQFTCNDGSCIDLQYLCDREYHCPDGSDEFDEACEKGPTQAPKPPVVEGCAANQWKCKDGTCIELSQRCDYSAYHCPDGSDEFDCENEPVRPEPTEAPRPTVAPRPPVVEGCAANQWKCKDGTCIELSQRCDRSAYHCPDGTDEFDCDEEPVRPEPEPEPTDAPKPKPPVDEGCAADQWQCKDGTCIELSQRCDYSAYHCPDGSDEFDCAAPTQAPEPGCSASEFTCNDGMCVHGSRRCDRQYDCPDASDEFDCPVETPAPPELQCSETEFRCLDNFDCIDILRRCDDFEDCRDGSDEQNCPVLPSPCGPNDFICGDGVCLESRFRCDGEYHCTDRTDEFACPISTEPPRGRCLANEFKCADGTCIEARYRCDFRYHCPDGSDEFECEKDEPTEPPVVEGCGANQWRCKDGTCIELSQRCDRSAYHCPDGSDEFDCDAPTEPPSPTCGIFEFTCGDGTCIDDRLKCDGRRDCPDGSDEDGCALPTEPPVTRCSVFEFTCGDGLCIDDRQRCDGQYDCFDGSDERGCEAPTTRPPRGQCRATEFRCEDGECVDAALRCNREYDCLDGSDEFDCPEPTEPPRSACSAVEFTCGDNSCIPIRLECDGKYDCADGSDEFDCPEPTEPSRPGCSAVEFSCSDNSCIPIRLRCDGQYDCVDGSDEQECPTDVCRTDQFECDDGRCIDASLRCNGNYDCGDFTDEVNCQCPSDKFQCVSGECIDKRRQCDGQPDCYDRSDEADCGPSVTVQLSVSPSQLRIREGVEASFVCRADGPLSSRLVWSRQPQGMPFQAVDRDGRLTISNVVTTDSGEYTCTAVDAPNVQPVSVRLTVDRIVGPTLRPPVPGGPCDVGEASCSNGACIPRDYVCDGDYDCTDRSDESNCLNPLPCEPNEFQCTSGKCILKIWRCDGDDDCGDRSDEQNCATAAPGAPCRADEYQCLAGDQCIPSAYHCDGEVDCIDKSDELGCTPPTIVRPPPSEAQARQGETITISCEAIGVPPPLIVWRLNWGHVGEPPRVTSTSEKSVDRSGGGRGFGVIGSARGEITIRQARTEDEGAYTCEAINSKGSVLATPDTILHVLPPNGLCSPPLFNSAAQTTRDCQSCFCFDRTTDCYSSNLFISQINPGATMDLVSRRDRRPAPPGTVEFEARSRQFTVRNYGQRLPGSDVYYWSLPSHFLSNKITSYGGELSYTAYSESRDGSKTIQQGPDVIVHGNGITLYHNEFVKGFVGGQHSAKVSLKENVWSTDERGLRQASKSDFMTVLQKIEYILIKSRYHLQPTDVRLGDVSMTTSTDEKTALGRATLVEQCSCPAEYTGMSCEQCAAGYYRDRRATGLGPCVACQCNGRARDCDPETGECRSCQDNAIGSQCEKCRPGFYSVSPSNQPAQCLPCPCPLPTPNNPFTAECFLDTDGKVTCQGCPPEYTGRDCSQCASGYEGNPLIPGETCQPASKQCDARGSASPVPDRFTRQCTCKANAAGPQCDSCKPNSFHLSEANPAGCISCFCMGVTQACTSTVWTRSQVTARFTRDTEGFTITNRRRENVFADRGLNTDSRRSEISFTDFDSLAVDDYYWLLPETFLGNKVTSYGGFLRYTVLYVPGFISFPTSYPDVEIGGNGVSLIYGQDRPQQIQANLPTPVQVPFYENQWVRSDGIPATREDLMMVLANLEYILIKAKYSEETRESSLQDVSMDIAESRGASLERASAVEECVCPQGYRGLSCESCDVGYRRTRGGLYLGTCQPCDCHGHSTECDSVTGQCLNCQHNTAGNECEVCARGYYGDATRGSVGDCQPCPCPLTTPPNQFSPTCFLENDDLVTCSACPVGHTGRQCESCLPGYRGDPLIPGSFCKSDGGRPDTDCGCDRQGTVPNTRCDPRSRSCQCKAFVEGRQCTTCQSGYYDLSESNPQGCTSCYCMGITNQCSSSNYYRGKIEPNYSPAHEFRLTTRRLTEQISDGVTANAAANEIHFDRFAGVQRERESLFWQLPNSFTGNQVASYGGKLEFELKFTLLPGSRGQPIFDADVEIISGEDRFYLFLQRQPSPDEFNSYTVQLTEASTSDRLSDSNTYGGILVWDDLCIMSVVAIDKQNSFRQADGAQPTRETFLRALASIDTLLIRSTFYTGQETAVLRDLTLDTAVPENTGLGLATSVEQCSCPAGYVGLSCEQCASGYSRVPDATLPFGRCVSCNCNGHATACDPTTGDCLGCQHNTEGTSCERCASGYYGNALAGTPNDCLKCPCPLTTPGNQFSPTCYLDVDGQPRCDQCQEGYRGRNCDQCAPGYFGDPNIPGESCSKTSGNGRLRVSINPARFSVGVGGTVTFRCIVNGNGRNGGTNGATYQWMRADGRPLSSRAAVTGNTMILQRVESTDEGRYICVASNRYGRNQAEAELTVSGERLLDVFIQQPKEQSIPVGGSVTFTCTGVSRYTYTLAWSRKDGHFLPYNIVDDGQGKLIIQNVQQSDEGTYVCTGSNYYTTAKDEAQLRITAGNRGPVVRIEPRQLSVDIREAAEFNCFATGFPPAEIEWTRGDGQVMPIDTVVENGALRFHAVTPQHQGEYHCTATNAFGSDRQSAILEVSSDMEPTFEVIVTQPQQQVVAGDQAQLSCNARGNIAQVQRIEWQKEGAELPPGAYQLNGQLVIPECKQTDSGRYVCTIHLVSGINRVAYTTLIISPEDIHRRDEPPTAIVEPQRQVVKQGSDIAFECIATGSPKPTISWTKARSELGPNQRIEGATLYTTNARPEDRGLYLCEVINAVGRSYASAILEVERQMPPVIEIYPEKSVTIDAGAGMIFQCRATEGIPSPTISWSRAGGKTFTQTAQLLDNGVLQFVGVTGRERGQYICTATNTAGSATYTVDLNIRGGDYDPESEIFPTRPSAAALPVISIARSLQTLRPGDHLVLQCSLTGGTPPVTVEWSKVEGSLSSSAYTDGGFLEIVTVTAVDAGKYQCLATNRAGFSVAVADVIILVPPSAIVSPRTVTTYEGQVAEFNCHVTGSPRPRVVWSKERGNMPARHTVEAGLLRIFDTEYRDSGRYICTVTNDVGTTRDYGELNVVEGSEGEFPIQDQQHNVTAGDMVRIICNVQDGNPPPVVVWERVDGPLPAGVQVFGNTLFISRATAADQGTYRCVASNIAGRVYQQVSLIVLGPPVVSVSRVTRTVSIGSNVTLTCYAQGSPNPVITWRKKDGQLARHHTVRDNWLNIYPMQESDYGEYICEARNHLGVGESVIVLEKSVLVAHFGQAFPSFATYPVIKDAYNSFDMELTFRPEAEDGLILYNGQFEWSGDFMSLGLVSGRVEFRFDVGSGPTVIVSDPVALDIWHTVRLRKDKSNGLLLVGVKEYTGRVEGRFVGLDLRQDMYLGGVPDYQPISRATGQRSGFVGCVSRLFVNGVAIDLGAEALRLIGVTDCPSCNFRPCLNGGTCRPAATKNGFQCQCAPGYSGANCELIGTKCAAETCGTYGHCYELPGVLGYKCACQLGKSGSRCEQGEAVKLPGFRHPSFAAYPTIDDALNSVQIQLTFFPQNLDDAVLFYDAKDLTGTSDFIALVIKDGYVEFRYDLGSGAAIITSSDPLPMEQWVTVVAELNNRDGSLVINEGIASKGQSAGNAVGLNLRTPLYIGGVDILNVRLAPLVGVERGFTGCISQLQLKGRTIDLVNDAVDGANVRDCSADAPPSCTLKPCQNGGTCEEYGGRIFCRCLTGFIGPMCEERTMPVSTAAQFSSAGGYVELPPSRFVHQRTPVEETVTMSVTTRQTNGILLWQGQKLGVTRSRDFYVIALDNVGRVVFSYELGSGPANISSQQRVNDGRPHSISVTRIGKRGALKIDGQLAGSGESAGTMTSLETSGSVFIGGVPDAWTMTGGRYLSTFVGCISDVYIKNRGPIDMTAQSVNIVGVLPCPV